MPNQDDIDLAVQGVEAWNEWAQRCPLSSVDFSEEDLTGISFAGFQFPGISDFTKTKFSEYVDFSGSTVFGDIDFSDSEFIGGGNFSKSKFNGEVSFFDSKFSGRAFFTKSIFRMGAFFIRSRFSSSVSFDNSEFFDFTYFNDSVFSNGASFEESTFVDWVDFYGGKFSWQVSFSKTSFRGYANFSNREFNASTNLRVKYFSQVPVFHGATIHQGTKFGNIDEIFTDFQSDDAEQCYRTLKLAMGKQQARTEETDFAALELKARRHRLLREAKTKPFWKRFPLWSECLGYLLWEVCSKSGRSFVRPLVGYLGSLLAFAVSYVLLPACKMQPPLYVLLFQGRNWGTGFRYSFLKQFSFGEIFRGSSNRIGALEAKLFCLNDAVLAPWWVDFLNSIQSIIAFGLIFLMGLGIRHKFRLR